MKIGTFHLSRQELCALEADALASRHKRRSIREHTEARTHDPAPKTRPCAAKKVVQLPSGINQRPDSKDDRWLRDRRALKLAVIRGEAPGGIAIPLSQRRRNILVARKFKHVQGNRRRCLLGSFGP